MKDYFKQLFNIQKQVAVHKCGYDDVQRANYVGGEPIKKNEVEVRVMKLKKGKAVSKDEVMREMIKGGGKMVMDWI